MDLNAFVCSLHQSTTSKLTTTIVDLDSGLEGAQCEHAVLETHVAAFLEQEARLGAPCCFISTQRVVTDSGDSSIGPWLVDGVYAVLSIQFAASAVVAPAGVERLLRSSDFDDRHATALLAEYASSCGGILTTQACSPSNATWRVYFRTLPDLADAFDVHDMPSSATVLLVEDEDFVRSVTREVLELSGYQVLEARNAVEGMELFERNRGKVDLLLTDVVMPGMNGPELVRRLSASAPGLRAIFMSGYTDNEVVRRGLGDPEIAYLQKPFTVELLARKVQEVLNTPPQNLPLGSALPPTQSVQY